jgi:hypothetical protein
MTAFQQKRFLNPLSPQFCGQTAFHVASAHVVMLQCWFFRKISTGPVNGWRLEDYRPIVHPKRWSCTAAYPNINESPAGRRRLLL